MRSAVAAPAVFLLVNECLPLETLQDEFALSLVEEESRQTAQRAYMHLLISLIHEKLFSV